MKYAALLAYLLLLPIVLAAQSRINYGSLSWSDDGSKLLFSCIEVKPDWSDYSPYKWRLYVYGLRRKTLELIDRAAIFGALSPDGAQVAYSKNTGASWDLFLKNLPGGEKRKLTDTPQRESAPDWSPDGRMIVFTSEVDKEATSIFSMDAQGKNVRRLTYNGKYNCLNPVFSPDGSRVAFYMEKGDKKDQVYVLELLTGFANNITRDLSHNFHPDWFDNRFLIYTRTKEELCLKPVEGGAAIPIEGPQSYFARYNPKHRLLAYIDKETQSVVVQKLKGSPRRLKAGKAQVVVSPEMLGKE
ncbi:MAG: PD40 domain-containing protein [Phaeodactylibacter sp.]|nr:PD40 domain-containing protein [Phaeodactylibacter sp.]